ncbi:CBS domain-containing protein [Aquisalibacillus elongatus]|uniref:Putative transcriptional regulator n=1 Tax=Aquisalibacillus elongatus TaxID=485577 RepID=A0A3N5B795_9BACI|nr:CBS domain-containing protein [Aquisalibacillus elongatus]RPF53304.1 putative transcriptional regulator [Aquisalibacillus elongatus]
MKNSERFLFAFNKIEKVLNEDLNQQGQYISFSKAVYKANKQNRVVKRFKDDLLEFAVLRNAIVHERTEPEYVIAEPHDSTVEKIEKILSELTEPKTVIPTFQQEVKSFDVNDSLADVLTVIKESNFSQFPVYDKEEFKGLLTANGITNWLAKTVEEDLLSREETMLSELIEYEEGTDNYHFVSRDVTIYEAEDIFKEQVNKEDRIDAILITHNGKTSEKLLGIISAWDIIDIP